jgi:hypothetical protein
MSVYRQYSIDGWGYTFSRPIMSGADVYSSGAPEIRRARPPARPVPPDRGR